MFPPFVIAMLGIQTGLVKLTGSSGSPNTSNDIELSGTAFAGWRALTTGVLQKIQADNWTDFSDQYFSVGGVAEDPQQDLWIRATLDAGDAPTSGTLGTWIKIAGGGAGAHTWSWSNSAAPVSTVEGDIKLEIATDSGGSNIVATGYYRGSALKEI